MVRANGRGQQIDAGLYLLDIIKLTLKEKGVDYDTLVKSVKPMSDDEYTQWQVDRANSQYGSFSNCSKCRGKGWIYKAVKSDWSTSLIQVITKCDCYYVKTNEARATQSGANVTIEKAQLLNFKVKYPYQRFMLDKANEFINDDNPDNQIFYCAGMSGCGKTTLCNGIWAHYITKGYDTKYMQWLSATRELKQLTNTPQYSDKFDEYVKVPVLLIDDMLKVAENEKPSAADVKFIRELIDLRMGNRKITIINTEIPLRVLDKVDTSLCGRIAQASAHGKYCLNIQDGRNLRYEQL